MPAAGQSAFSAPPGTLRRPQAYLQIDRVDRCGIRPSGGLELQSLELRAGQT